VQNYYYFLLIQKFISFSVVITYGIDDYTHNTVKLPYKEVEEIANHLEIKLVKKYFEKTFNSKEELMDKCQQIFDAEKANGKIIEGIVVRNETGTFSAKVVNLLYDSKK